MDLSENTNVSRPPSHPPTRVDPLDPTNSERRHKGGPEGVSYYRSLVKRFSHFRLRRSREVKVRDLDYVAIEDGVRWPVFGSGPTILIDILWHRYKRLGGVYHHSRHFFLVRPFLFPSRLYVVPLPKWKFIPPVRSDLTLLLLSVLEDFHSRTRYTDGLPSREVPLPCRPSLGPLELFVVLSVTPTGSHSPGVVLYRSLSFVSSGHSVMTSDVLESKRKTHSTFRWPSKVVSLPVKLS